jgi:hypothetical protein
MKTKKIVTVLSVAALTASLFAAGQASAFEETVLPDDD